MSLLCMCFVVWSIVPSINHVPNVVETLQEHMEMIEDHGHSHSFAEDMLAALHGHNHDAIDHDHSKAFTSPSERISEDRLMAAAPETALWLEMPNPFFRIERPPRV